MMIPAPARSAAGFLPFFLKLLSFQGLALAIDITISGSHNGEAVSNLTLVPKPPSRGRTPGNGSTSDPFQRGRSKKTPPVSYSGNWCGASQHTNSSDLLRTVSGFWNVPVLHIRPDTDTPQFVAAWVGMDGASCQDRLIQAGTTTEIQADGTQTASAWFEWLPDAAFAIPNMPVAPNQIMGVHITAYSHQNVTILVRNADEDFTIQINLLYGAPLCRVDAEWIVENFHTNFGQTPFARFEDVWFQGCEAETAGGRVIDVGDATMVYLANGGGGSGGGPSCWAWPWSEDSGVFWAQSS